MAVIKGLEWTFNTEAEKYEKMRPGYVPALYDDIFHFIPISNKSNVLEIGIGGGQATLPILRTGCKLTAVEYGENFVTLCQKKFEDFANFTAVASKFEDYPFENDSLDLIYSASAFHWVPEEIGYNKVFALLKSGGAFARFANHPYKDKGREAIHEAIQKIYAVYMPDSKFGREYSEEDAFLRAKIAGKYGFTDISHKLYHRTRHFTAAEYIELLGTYSDHIAIPEITRNKFFFEIEEAINSLGGEITMYDTLDLELARKP